MTTTTSVRPTRYREIEAAGEPRELGRQWGEAAREEIRRFVAFAWDIVAAMPISTQHALSVAERSGQMAEQYAPHMIDELRGAADAAGVSLAEMLLLQVRNQLPGPPTDGCTSFSTILTGADGTRHLVGQNWDSDPRLDDVTIVLTRRPRGKPATINVTQAGLIAYIGMNDAGLGVCLNTLPSPCRRHGVPHYFTVRGIYESRTLDEAVGAVSRAERAIGANIMLATPGGPADLEVTITEVCVLRDGVQLTHTNHCLDERLVRYNSEFPELIESHPRKARVDQLLVPARSSLASLQSALRDHEGYPGSICRHAVETVAEPAAGQQASMQAGRPHHNDLQAGRPHHNDLQAGRPHHNAQHAAWTTVFSVVLDTTARRMYLTRGNPCTHPYEEYELA